MTSRLSRDFPDRVFLKRKYKIFKFLQRNVNGKHLMRCFQSDTSVKTAASKAEALQLQGQHKNSMNITSYPYYIRAPYVLRWWFVQQAMKEALLVFKKQKYISNDLGVIFSCNISNTRVTVSSGYPKTEKRVENTTRSGVFLTKFEVFG